MKQAARQELSHSKEHRRTLMFQATAIVLALVAVYSPSWHAGFVWDDEQLVTRNPLLQNVSGLIEIWSGGRTADYFPIANTVFWIEWYVFGNNSFGFHLVNILFQAADALLVWLVLFRLKIPGAWLAAFIFAIHPLNAESVAWISELKNVLSMFFVLLSVLCFFESEDRRLLSPTAAYFASIVFFILALLSKSQVVFLPIMLLLCSWWRSGDFMPLGFRRQLIRTLPFFCAAIVFGIVTIWFQNRGIGEEQIAIGSLGRRLANAGLAVWWYGAKIFVPARLMAIYPRWEFDSVGIYEWLPLIGLVLLMVLAWLFRDRGTRGVFFAITAFVVALSPVLGLFRMAYLRSGTLVADHFVYFATVSLIALFAAAVTALWNRVERAVRILISALLGLALVALGICTSTRAAVFASEETLWSDTLLKNPDAWQAHARLGQLFFDRQQFEAALPHLQRAIELKPELADDRNLLGLDYCRLGRFEKGIAEYRTALQLKEAEPLSAKSASVATIRTNLANALTITANNLSAGAVEIPNEAMQRYDEAVAQYEKALELEPRQPAIHRNLGMLLARLGRYNEAKMHLRETLEIVPNEPIARETLDAIESKGR